jgi:hypothetical protein
LSVGLRMARRRVMVVNSQFLGELPESWIIKLLTII